MSKQQQPTVSTQVAQRRIPTILVIVDLCQANATFPVKIDYKMTTEILREVALQLFHTFCRDSGIPFNPPSQRPVDYTLLPCFEDGQIDATFQPLQLAAHGGGTLRDQMAHLPTPCYVSMVIGQQWLDRDAMLRDEEQTRSAISKKRDETISSMEYFYDVSKERALDLAQQRERQEVIVSKAENVMCYLFVAWSRNQRKIAHESELLEKGQKLWEQQRGRYEKELEEIAQKKRMFLQSSITHVLTLTQAMHNAHGVATDAKRETILQLLEGFSQ